MTTHDRAAKPTIRETVYNWLDNKQPGTTSIHDPDALVKALEYREMQQERWVIVAEGEGAAARVLDAGADLHAAVHEFMCVCGKPWKQCDSLTPEELRFIDDPDEWTTDEDGERFSCSMLHETGSITIYRLERLAATEPADRAAKEGEGRDWVTDLDDLHATLAYHTPPFKDRAEAFEKFLARYRASLAASQPPQELEGLRETFDKITCDWCRLGFERLANGMHVTFTSGIDGIPKFRHENTPCVSKATEILAALTRGEVEG
jgi:hypothetical protein